MGTSIFCQIFFIVVQELVYVSKLMYVLCGWICEYMNVCFGWMNTCEYMNVYFVWMNMDVRQSMNVNMNGCIIIGDECVDINRFF